MARPLPTHPPRHRWIARLAGAYLALALLLTLAMQVLADRWWPATVLMFAPRWIWALPLALLLPAALLWRRSALRLLLPAAALLAFGVLGFNLPDPAAWLQRGGHADLRVASYNIGETTVTPGAVAQWLAELAPDVVAFQECDATTGEALLKLRPLGWFVEAQPGSCVVSRHKIAEVQARSQDAIWKMGGAGMSVRYRLDTPAGPVTLVNHHLETVREGLQQVVDQGLAGADAMEDNLGQRDLESLLAREFTRQAGGPLLVTGDFNMPVESAIYRRHWSDLGNAFSQAGLGLGHTKETRWHGIRIDHVLLGPGWVASEAWVGPGLGGDHLPMLADLRWTGTPPAPTPPRKDPR